MARRRIHAATPALLDLVSPIDPQIVAVRMICYTADVSASDRLLKHRSADKTIVKAAHCHTHPLMAGPFETSRMEVDSVHHWMRLECPASWKPPQPREIGNEPRSSRRSKELATFPESTTISLKIYSLVMAIHSTFSLLGGNKKSSSQRSPSKHSSFSSAFSIPSYADIKCLAIP